MTDHFESCYRTKCKLLGIFSVSSDMGVRTHVEDKECSAGGADQVNHYGKSLLPFSLDRYLRERPGKERFL